MRRIYITAIPFHQNFIISQNEFHPINFTSRYGEDRIHYIISPIIAETMREGDTGKLIVLHQSDGTPEKNLEILKEELVHYGVADRVEITEVEVRESQEAELLLDVFRRLTAEMEDGASYYMDITFGSKSFPLIQMAALSYADNILKDTVINGIYYHEIKRKEGKPVQSQAYDMQVLYSLTSLMSAVAGADPADRKAMVEILVGKGE